MSIFNLDAEGGLERPSSRSVPREFGAAHPNCLGDSTAQPRGALRGSLCGTPPLWKRLGEEAGGKEGYWRLSRCLSHSGESSLEERMAERTTVGFLAAAAAAAEAAAAADDANDEDERAVKISSVRESTCPHSRSPLDTCARAYSH